MGTEDGRGSEGAPAVAAVERARAALAARDPVVRAWVAVDEDGAAARARAVDASASPLPLAGLVLGVKDAFDTADFPTEYGSPIYRGFRPRADAAVVAALVDAGAVPLGKTVTAEFAFMTPGPTTNPHRASHTPGGSSSGSAAAVAAGMADLAVGSQTAGSVLRPASFCGVYGFKPTFGAFPVTGLKLVAPSLDTVGLFARTAGVLAAAWRALAGGDPAARTGPPRLALVRTGTWERADADSRAAVEAAADLAASAGAVVVERDLPGLLDDLTERHQLVHAFEAARSLRSERRRFGDQLSERLRDLLDRGARIPAADHARVLADASSAGPDLARLLAGVDAIVTPAAVGEAPEGLDTTGDPHFTRLWTLLGLPAVSVPGRTGRTGLPVGVQLVARRGHDHELLRLAHWLGARLAG